MQKTYFDSQEVRREFLANLNLTVDQVFGNTPITDEKDEDISLQEYGPSHGYNGFVYFIRNRDLCKIGITEGLLRRMYQLKPDLMLNIVRCKNFRELEKDLHSLLKDVRIPQTEYFRLSEEQESEVHKLMTSFADF